MLIHKHHPAPTLVCAPGPAHHLAASTQDSINTPPRVPMLAAQRRPPAAWQAHGAPWTPPPCPPPRAGMHTSLTHDG
ncbi:hypothetical protein HaLaN_18296 [Haematococcus lacustris]|uniref:Uncharacterized protein n=1 Tax=Haematococcus lacustris TaxID=44745 RepID=A0A699ZEP2_HAELA|nr:hypothetical protein HaLaN_18296 [Haematococcus lacustris]